MAAKDGTFGRIVAEAEGAADRDDDGVQGRLAARGGASSGDSVRSRLLQGLARSGGFSRQASFGAGSGKGPKLELRLNTRQRVIVKAHVAKHGARGFGGGGGGGALRAHVVYLGREGSDGPERGEFYDRDGEGLDAKAHVRDWADDRHHFRFIISPEHGDKLEDLRGFVRGLMDEVATDLREPGLDWIAVNHFDTDQPHAHGLVRGAREDGRALMIQKDYMARGFRARAEDRATQELGEVSRDQAEERLRKEVTADRVTGLDRHLEKSLVEGRVPADFIDDRHTTGTLLRGRLQHLEGLGLAAKEGRDWRLAEGFTQSL
ncbi:MAG: type VI secretion protein, partial [Alphaproteobacteria bacterium]|nr:type VI secretion protein [Alphaproteobacteria bacterium]